MQKILHHRIPCPFFDFRDRESPSSLDRSPQKAKPQDTSVGREKLELLKKQSELAIKKAESQEAYKQAEGNFSVKKTLMGSYIYSRILLGQNFTEEQRQSINYGKLLQDIRSTVELGVFTYEGGKITYEDMRNLMKSKEGRKRLLSIYLGKSLSSQEENTPSLIKISPPPKIPEGESPLELNMTTVPKDFFKQSDTEGKKINLIPKDTLSSTPQYTPEPDIEEPDTKELENVIRQVDEAEYEYTDAKLDYDKTISDYSNWAEDYRQSIIEENNPPVKQDELTQEGGGENRSEVFSTPAEIARLDRVNTFLSEESGFDKTIEIEKDERGLYDLSIDGVIIDKVKWKDFPTKRDALRAKIRYELFAIEPLDVFRREGPAYIDKMRDDPDIQRIWRSLAPESPFSMRMFRRLIMVSLMKKMNGDLENMSFHEIVNAYNPLYKNFQNQYAEYRGKIGLKNAGKEDIDTIMRVVKNTKWKNDTVRGMNFV